MTPFITILDDLLHTLSECFSHACSLGSPTISIPSATLMFAASILSTTTMEAAAGAVFYELSSAMEKSVEAKELSARGSKRKLEDERAV